MTTKIERLEKILGYTFKDKTLLTLAITHPSYAFENQVASNQRLEFLGDAVLSLVTAEQLFRQLKEAPEGVLTQKRSEIVQGTTLTDISRRLNLGRFLLLGKGEEKQSGHKTPSNLANVLESIVGAIYLDSGLNACRGFIRRHFFAEQKSKPAPASRNRKRITGRRSNKKPQTGDTQTGR